MLPTNPPLLLAHILSHELRTPLTLIVGAASLLDETDADPQLLSVLNSGVERLIRLTDRVTLYSELDQVNSPLIEQTYSTQQIFERAKRNIDHLYPDARIQARVSEATLPGYAPYIEALLYELIANAVVASRGKLVHVTWTVEGRASRLIIEDEGWGIDPDLQPLVWQPYYQAERLHYEQQGIGFGLPIVSRIVALHGGSVTLHSAPNVGTTVVVWLPC